MALLFINFYFIGEVHNFIGEYQNLLSQTQLILIKLLPYNHEKKPDHVLASLLIAFNQFLFKQFNELIHHRGKYGNDEQRQKDEREVENLESIDDHIA